MSLVRKRIVLPLIPTDIFQVIRPTQSKDTVLDLTYQQLLAALSEVFSGGGSLILLQTDGVDNGDQNLLNLVAGSGITLSDDGLGSVTITSSGGASFITSVADTASIDLTVTSGVLTADLVNIVAAGTFGNATTVPQITIDTKGRVTSVASVPITAGTGSVTNVSASVPSPTTPALSVTVTNPTTTPAIAITANGTTGQYIRGDGSLATLPTAGTGTVTSVDLTMPSAFAVTGNPITTSGTLAVTGAGTTSQYVRGDGSLATYNPGTGGGGASVSYYLNGSVNQTPTIGGLTYKQMSKVPVIGAGTDFTINADGYIQSFITDVGTPNQLLIPGGNWNFEMWFNSSSSGGSPKFYIDVCTFDGTTLTTIGTSSAVPENITGGTAIDLYTTAVAVPQTILLATDRIAIRVYVIHSSKTIKLHTEGPHLCQVITTFTTGITALNGLTDQVQNFATPGTTGTAPNWNSVSPNHTLNIPLASTASVTAGLISKSEFDLFSVGSFGVTVDGVTSVIQVGQTGFVVMPYAGTITGWSITTNASGSIQFDVWKAAGAIPVLADSIVASAPPTLTTAQFVTSTTLTGWTTTFAAGDVFGFYVNSVSSTVKNATLTIRCTKS